LEFTLAWLIYLLLFFYALPRQCTLQYGRVMGGVNKKLGFGRDGPNNKNGFANNQLLYSCYFYSD